MLVRAPDVTSRHVCVEWAFGGVRVVVACEALYSVPYSIYP
jgi:hypothetical protein